MTAYPWRLAAVLFCAAAINYADRTALSAVLPLLRDSLHLDNTALGGIGAVFLWSYAAASPFAGLLADRFPRGRILLLSLTAWSLATALTFFVQTYWQLAATRVLLGLAECLYLPAATALLADHHSSSTRGAAMGIHSAGLNLGLVAGGVLAGFLGQHYGWRTGFLALGLAGLALAALAFRTLAFPPALPPAPPRHSSLLKDLRQLASIPTYFALMLMSLSLAVGIWMFLNWLPLYFHETHGLSLAAAGFSGTFPLQSAALLGVVAGGLISDRLARRGPRYRVLFMAACYAASAPFLLAFLLHPSLLLISTCIFGFSLFRNMGQSNENPTLCEVVPPPLRSTAIGFINLMNAVAGGLAVLLAGLLKTRFTLETVFAAPAAFMLLAALVLLLADRHTLPRDLPNH